MSRLAGIIFLVALLLVPLGLSGHHEHHFAGSRACASCVLAHHSPALATPAVSLSTVLHASVPVAPEPMLVAVRADRSPHVGRAPPVPASRQSV